MPNKYNGLTQQEYLYGKDVEVPSIPADIIMRRVELLNDNLEELLDVPFFKRDGLRVNAVIKAKEFWLKINEDMK